MAKKLYDLAVKTGSYTDREGNEKGRWLNVGAVMQGDDGGKFIMLQRTFNPAGVPDLSGRGSDSILLSMFEPKDQGGEQRQQQGGQQRQSNHQQQKKNGFQPSDDDDIPF